MSIQRYSDVLWFTVVSLLIGSFAVRPALVWGLLAFNILGLLALPALGVVPLPDDPQSRNLAVVKLILLVDILVPIGALCFLNAWMTRHYFDRVNAAAREAALASELAVAASQAKSAFLANMSHELRTPLNAIIGYAEILIEEQEAAAPELVEDVQRIHTSGRHLLGLINDVLDLSRVEAGQMSVAPETFALGPLLATLRDTLAPQARSAGTPLSFDMAQAPQQLTTDRDKLRQLLLNLLSNAVKFTQAGAVTLRVTREGEGRVCFSGRDTGIGMSPQVRSRIFQAFVQAAPSTTRRYGGTGLGLALSRRLADLLGGTLTVESAEGQGSTFSLIVPERLGAPGEALIPSYPEASQGASATGTL